VRGVQDKAVRGFPQGMSNFVNRSFAIGDDKNPIKSLKMDEILDNWMFDEQEKKRLQFYKDFVSLEEARAFANMLDAHQIPYSAEVPKLIIDQTFVGTGMLPNTIIKLLPEDFQKVNALVTAQLAGATYSDVRDHYLNQFEDDELMAVFEKPDEWSIEDVQVAKVILRERGVAISDEAIQQQRTARLQAIRKGRMGNKAWMLFYFLSIILIIMLHPIFFIAGVGMGYYYAYGRDVDLDGHKHFVFEPQTRFYGKFILYGGLLVLLVELLMLWNVF